jgi:energy-coupling factor transporter ATP-binding protein EcfA2
MDDTTVTKDRYVSLAEAASLIVSVPENRFCLVGEPGIGKSSILKPLAQLLPAEEYEFTYVDVPSLELGDTAIPVPNKESKILEYLPNGRFKLHTNKKVVICLDEFGKGADPVKNMLHPLLEENAPRLADRPLPEGSLVFLTGNFRTDGVGDNLKAHTIQRISEVKVRKPDADEWLLWAAANNIAREVRAWVKMFPDSLASYRDPGQGSNPYIFNPRKPTMSAVSPRTLSRASNIVHRRKQLTPNAVHAALAGTAGDAFADSFAAYLQFSDQLPPMETLVTNPTAARVPTESGAQAILVYGMIDMLSKETVDPFMQYVVRLNPDWTACFCISVAKDPDKQHIAFSNPRFSAWCAENQDLL